VSHAWSPPERHLIADQSRAAGARAATWLSIRAAAYVAGWALGNAAARTYYAINRLTPTKENP
jgi:hypothetical protein